MELSLERNSSWYLPPRIVEGRSRSVLSQRLEHPGGFVFQILFSGRMSNGIISKHVHTSTEQKI